MTKKTMQYSKWKRLSISVGLICVLLLSGLALTGCAEEEYDLTMRVSPSGSGSTSPSVGTHSYDEDEVVSITATAATDYEFDSWTGDVANPSLATTTVTMDDDKTVTAVFTEVAPAVVTYTLTMAKVGNGTTTPDVGTSTHDTGATVTVTATADTGWQFDGWTPAAAVVDGEVTMDAAKTVTANFSQIMHTLTMAVNDAAFGSTDPAVGANEVAEGDVAIAATAATGYEFVNWTGDDVADVADADAASTTITVDADKTVTANFAEITYTLTMAKVGSGTITPEVGAHTTDFGEVVDITATPDTGWGLVNWTGDVADANSATTTVTMNADKTVTANFGQIFTLTIAVTGDGSTTPAVGDHEYADGTVVDITATPDDGWYFVNWTGDVADVNSAATTVTVDAAKTVTATFTDVTYTLTLAVNPAASGTTDPAAGAHTYGAGRVVTITATAPTYVYEFDNWTGDVADADSATTTVTVDAAKTVTANFSELPYPSVGTTWVYDVKYDEGGAREDITVWTVTVDRLETEAVSSEDCYVTVTSFSADPARFAQVALTVTSYITWLSQATLDQLANERDLTMLVNEVWRTYTGGTRGAPYTVGQTWTYDELVHPGSFGDYTDSFEAAVVVQEDMLGYSCYKIVHTRTASTKGNPTDVVTLTEWWSPDVQGVVKVISDGYDDTEVWELAS